MYTNSSHIIIYMYPGDSGQLDPSPPLQINLVIMNRRKGVGLYSYIARQIFTGTFAVYSVVIMHGNTKVYSLFPSSTVLPVMIILCFLLASASKTLLLSSIALIIKDNVSLPYPLGGQSCSFCSLKEALSVDWGKKPAKYFRRTPTTFFVIQSRFADKNFSMGGTITPSLHHCRPPT